MNLSLQLDDGEPENRSKLKIALARALCTQFADWKLLPTRMLEISDADWLQEAGKQLVNLRSRLDSRQAEFDSQWRSIQNTVTAKRWPQRQTVVGLLELCKRPLSLGSELFVLPGYDEYRDFEVRKRLMLTFYDALPSLPECLYDFKTWRAHVMRENIPARINETLTIATNYAERWKPKTETGAYIRVKAFLRDLNAHVVTAHHAFERGQGDLVQFEEDVRRLAFKAESSLLRTALSSNLNTLLFSDAGFAQTLRAVWTEEPRQSVLRVLEQHRSRNLEVRRLIMLNYLEPERYLQEQLEALVRDLIELTSAGVCVHVARISDVNGIVGVGKDDPMANFAIADNGTIMRADNTHTLWHLANIDPMSREHKWNMIQVREMYNLPAARRALCTPNDVDWLNKNTLHDKNKMAFAVAALADRLSAAAARRD